MKNIIIYRLMFILSSLLTNIMCIFVTYRYTVVALINQADSAPSYVTLIYCIPFIILISILLSIGFIFLKKHKNTK